MTRPFCRWCGLPVGALCRYHDGDLYPENRCPTHGIPYPRWEVRPGEPGGLAWVTSASEFEDNGFDIEELFRHLDWRASESTRAAVDALVEIVKKGTP